MSPLDQKIHSEYMHLSLIQISCGNFLWSIGVLCGRFSGFRLWERISLFGVTIADCYKKKIKGNQNNVETKAKGKEAHPLIIFTKS